MPGQNGSLLGNDPLKPSRMQRSERPGDRLTLEEKRLDLCSSVGPYRVWAGTSRIITLRQGMTSELAVGRGLDKVPTFVRIEPLKYTTDKQEYKSFDLVLTKDQIGGGKRAVSTITAFVDVILLAGEYLYGNPIDLSTQPVVGEVEIQDNEEVCGAARKMFEAYKKTVRDYAGRHSPIVAPNILDIHNVSKGATTVPFKRP